VRVRIAFVDVVNVVRRDELQAEFLGELDQLFVHLGLFRNAVVLQFEKIIFRAERLLEEIHRVSRFLDLILHDQIRKLAGETAGQRDQPFAVLGENFLVNARLVIIAVNVRVSDQLDEVFVAGFVLRQQAEVMIHVAHAAALFPFQPRTGRDVDLAADDGLDALGPRRLVKFNCAEHRAVVGDGQRGKLQFVGLFDQPVQPARAIEQ
jgi:hypothetical protein